MLSLYSPDDLPMNNIIDLFIRSFQRLYIKKKKECGYMLDNAANYFQIYLKVILNDFQFCPQYCS